MWDNPRLLNMLAGFLVGLVVLAFTLVALQLALRSPLWPVQEVTIQGDLEHTMRSEIEAALSSPSSADEAVTLSHEYARLKEDIAARMGEWEAATLEAEAIGAV